MWRSPAPSELRAGALELTQAEQSLNERPVVWRQSHLSGSGKQASAWEACFVYVRTTPRPTRFCGALGYSRGAHIRLPSISNQL